MYEDRQLDGLPQRGDQIEALLRAHDAGHVLDADGLTAHGLHLAGQADVHFEVVDGRQRVADRALRVSARRETGLDRRLDVAHIVQRVEDADDVDAVFNRRLNEAAHGVVRIVAVAQNILAAQQHLELGVLHVLLDGAQALPGVLVQIAQTGIERRTAPAFDRIISGRVHLVERVLEIGQRHARRHQGLLRVAQDGFRNIHFHGLVTSFT